MCQVSTHPPRVFATNLTVLGNRSRKQIKVANTNLFPLWKFVLTAPAIRLVDEMQHEVSEAHLSL